MKIKSLKDISKFNISNCLIFILTLFTLTFFIYRDFGLRMIYGFAALSIILIFYFINHIFIKKEKPKITAIEILLFITISSIIIFFIFPNSRKDEDTLSYIIVILISFFYMLFSNKKQLNENGILISFIITASLFTIYILFFTAFPKFFYTVINPYLSKEAAQYSAYYLKRGYTVSIGGFTYTDYILFFGIASSIAIFITNKNKTIKYILSAIITIIICTIFIIGRRGEFLACILSLFFLYIIKRNKKKRNKELLFLFIFVSLATLLFLIFIKQLEKISFFKRYIFTLKQIMAGKDFSSGRGELYIWALNMFSKSPLWGNGWGSFANVVSPEYQLIHGSHGGIVKDAHNNFLQILAETGVIGFVFIVIPLIYIYVLTIKHIKNIFNYKFEDNVHIIKIKKLAIVSFLTQTFFMILSFFDPCTYKLIFCCMYVISTKFISISIELSNYEYPNFINKFIHSILKKKKI